MKKSTRWAWGVAAVAFAGVTMVLLFVLSLTGDAGSFVERHIAWLFWLNVAVALFLLVVIALAALRGVPLYSAATATLWRPRWYWRDDRIVRAHREWRLTYQPLTSTWRVSQGA